MKYTITDAREYVKETTQLNHLIEHSAKYYSEQYKLYKVRYDRELIEIKTKCKMEYSRLLFNNYNSKNKDIDTKKRLNELREISKLLKFSLI